MQAFASGGTIEPVYVTVAAIVVVGALTLWVLRSALSAREKSDPLEGLFDSSTFDTRLDLVAERTVFRRPRRPIPLHGQRAQMARLREVWGTDTRAEAIEDVARVMRAGKGNASAPVQIHTDDPKIAISEWEEVKLLPPPASPSIAHKAA